MQLAHGALEARHRADLLGPQIIHRRRVEGGCERVALERAVAKVVGRAEEQRGLGVSQPIVLEEVGRARVRLLEEMRGRVRVHLLHQLQPRRGAVEPTLPQPFSTDGGSKSNEEL